MPDIDAQHLILGVANYLVLLLSLSFHESAHAWMALKLGDDTAASLGRISLNPMVHIDPFGTVLMPLLQIFGGAPLLGWAKPTPYNPARFRSDVTLRRGHISVAVAGPLSNLILALGFAILFAIAVRIDVPRGIEPLVFYVIQMGVIMNIGLAIFNMVPIPPLDGSHVVSWGLPRPAGEKFDRFTENLGGPLLWILVLSGVFGQVLGPIRSAVTDFLFTIAS